MTKLSKSTRSKVDMGVTSPQTIEVTRLPWLVYNDQGFSLVYPPVSAEARDIALNFYKPGQEIIIGRADAKLRESITPKFSLPDNIVTQRAIEINHAIIRIDLPFSLEARGTIRLSIADTSRRGTFVNRLPILPRGKFVPLNLGDVIGLGTPIDSSDKGRYFAVRYELK